MLIYKKKIRLQNKSLTRINYLCLSSLPRFR